MAEQRLVRDVFLWCMASIYMFAFTSLYLQIPGLYGSSGLLPAKNMLRKDSRVSSYESFLKQPTLLWFAGNIGLTTETAMDLLCLVGAFLSLMAIVAKSWRSFGAFLTLWFLYFSLYQVGQTFLWFQWDILLLESGFLCLLVAPVRRTRSYESFCQESISLWLVKWLLFRLMFASGVVKLTSRCPTWWGLTALNWHYESQCIPTSLAWYAHQLPDWFQKFSVVMTYVIEGPIPFLFFAPVRSLRIFAFYLQVLFQFLIILTGNYNFFNLLTLTLCLSLVDDRHVLTLCPWLAPETPSEPASKRSSSSWIHRLLNILRKLIIFAVMFALIYWTKRLFSVHINRADIVYTKVAFTPDQFNDALSKVVPISIWLGALSLTAEIIFSLVRTFRCPGMFMKLWSVFHWFVMVCAAIWIFSISLVPFTNLHRGSHENIWPVVKRWYDRVHSYEVVNSYGLFRRMTGVGGRPELVIEGSDSVSGPWKEYKFLYKPGALDQRPPFLVPHQARLDWQMWFAALGSYQHNPWFVHLVYKLLIGEKVVLDLLATNQPFRKPPRYIRALLYKYHYTKIKRNSSVFDVVHNIRSIKYWWRREFSSEYLPPLSKSEPTLLQFLNHYQLGSDTDKAEQLTGRAHVLLSYLRSKVRRVDPFKFILCLFAYGVASNLLLNQRFDMEARIKDHMD